MSHQQSPTPGHIQTQTDHVAFYYPAHAPRETDPHYKLFAKSRKRAIAAGVGCWICGTHENLEDHHQEVEFAAANGVDFEQLSADHPEYHIDDEESFLCWLESEGNLLILCAAHHRDPFIGIHHCPEPNWKLQKYWKKDLPAPVQNPSAVTIKVPAQSTTVVETADAPATVTVSQDEPEGSQS